MPPNFEDLANGAFKIIKRSLGLKKDEAIYFPKSGGSVDILGIFDNRAVQVDPDTEQVVSSNIFTFGIQLSDLKSLPEKGDKITIKNVKYKVFDSQEDGMPGVSTVLFLHKTEINK